MCGSSRCRAVHAVLVFFVKQKTAYEMRISDWSSDVCSSDLSERRMLRVVILMHRRDRVVLEGQYPEILIIVERAIGPIDLGLPLFDHGVSLGQHRTIGNKRGAQRLRSEPALDKLAFLGQIGRAHV